MALRNQAFRKWLLAQSTKLYARKCKGCGDSSPHSHHLSLLGKWHFIGRYRVLDAFTHDSRPQPPPAGDWYANYLSAWKKQFPKRECESGWVRDESGVWVWVTNTPIFDRDWFDEQGWRFPVLWITTTARDFYVVGSDDISTIVSLPGREFDKQEST